VVFYGKGGNIALNALEIDPNSFIIRVFVVI